MTEVVGALIRENDKFLIFRRPPNKGNPLKWEFVGGKLEKGENASDALIRECREELDITVHPGKIVCDVVHQYPDITVHLTVLDTELTESNIKLLEHVDMKWVSVSDAENIDFCDADIDILPEIFKYIEDCNNER